MGTAQAWRVPALSPPTQGPGRWEMKASGASPMCSLPRKLCSQGPRRIGMKFTSGTHLRPGHSLRLRAASPVRLCAVMEATQVASGTRRSPLPTSALLRASWKSRLLQYQRARVRICPAEKRRREPQYEASVCAKFSKLGGPGVVRRERGG